MAFEYKHVHQHGDYVSAFIKADPDVKEYTAMFNEDRFIISTDG